MIHGYLLLNMEKKFRENCPFDFAGYQRIKHLVENFDLQENKDFDYATHFITLNNMQCDEKSVYRFMKSVFEKLFPVQFFGENNYKVVKSYLKKLVVLKRFETFCIKDILNRMDLKEVPWFKRKFNPLFSSNFFEQKKNLIISLLAFIFDQFLMLIKANFYVTDKQEGHNQLFYYPKSVWFLTTQLGTL